MNTKCEILDKDYNYEPCQIQGQFLGYEYKDGVKWARFQCHKHNALEFMVMVK